MLLPVRPHPQFHRRQDGAQHVICRRRRTGCYLCLVLASRNQASEDENGVRHAGSLCKKEQARNQSYCGGSFPFSASDCPATFKIAGRCSPCGYASPGRHIAAIKLKLRTSGRISPSVSIARAPTYRSCRSQFCKLRVRERTTRWPRPSRALTASSLTNRDGHCGSPKLGWS